MISVLLLGFFLKYWLWAAGQPFGLSTSESCLESERVPAVHGKLGSPRVWSQPAWLSFVLETSPAWVCLLTSCLAAAPRWGFHLPAEGCLSWDDLSRVICRIYTRAVKGDDIPRQHMKRCNVIYKFRQAMSSCLLSYKKSSSSPLGSKGRGSSYWAIVWFLIFLVGNLSGH